MSTIIDPDTLDYNKLRDEMDKINEILIKKEAANKKITTTDQSSNLEKIQKTLKWSIIILVIIIVIIIIIIIIYKVMSRPKSVYIHDYNYEQQEAPVYNVKPPKPAPQPVYKVVQPPPQPVYKVVQPPPQPVYKIVQPPPQPVYKVVQPPPQPVYKVVQPPPQPVYKVVQPPTNKQPIFNSSEDSLFTSDSSIWTKEPNMKKINGGNKMPKY